MIFIDSNIPMYLVGAPHPHKVDSQRWLERLSLDEAALVTDAEVLQEILHRFRVIGRPEAIQPAFDVLLGVVDQVFPVDLDAVRNARDVLLARWAISARDAIHVAVMEQWGVRSILSFDRGFDLVPGIARLGG